jgi:hypothetical protein
MGSSGRAIEAIGTRLVTRHAGDVRGTETPGAGQAVSSPMDGAERPAPPFAYADNYLIDLKARIILEVKAKHAHTHYHGS